MKHNRLTCGCVWSALICGSLCPVAMAAPANAPNLPENLAPRATITALSLIHI